MYRRVFFIVLFIITSATEITFADFYKTPGFSVNTGFEYQLITQEYYNSIIDTTSLDPIERWVLAKDEINDLLFQSELGYRLENLKSRFDITGDFEISDERFLGSLESQLSFGDLDNFLKTFFRYENKTILDNDLSCNDDYHFGEGYLRIGKGVTKDAQIELKAGFETVIFDKQAIISDSGSERSLSSLYNYNYSIISGQISGEIDLGEFTHNLYWSARYQHRAVPDSAAAIYDDLRLNTEYTSISLEGYFNVEGEFRIKDYNQPDNGNDYFNLILRSHLSKNISSEYEASLATIFENYWYRQIDFVNQDYHLIRSQLNFTYQIKNLHLGPLIRIELKDEVKYENTSDSYTQWEFGVTSNILGQESLFFDLEATYGERIYHDEQIFLTSYNFYTVSVIANYVVYKGISVDMIFDGNFELHEKTENNSNLYLLSLALNAHF